MAGKKSSAGKKNEKETVKGNTEQEVAEPEITEPGAFWMTAFRRTDKMLSL